MHFVISKNLHTSYIYKIHILSRTEIAYCPLVLRQRVILVHIYLKFSGTVDLSFKSSRS